MSKPYSIQRRRGTLAVVFRDAAGKRHRHALGTLDKDQAELLAPAIYSEAVKPKGRTVRELWDAYNRAKAGRAILTARETTWKALRERFADVEGDAVTTEDCDAYMAARYAQGRKDSTVYTELSHLRTTLVWAERQGLLSRAPYIKRPPTPEPREVHITKEEARRLIGAAELPHVKLYILLALGTGARNAALLGLTWDRCDFLRGTVDFKDPELKRRHKGRAIVPMNKMLREGLTEAHKVAESRWVISWRGKPVKSVKKSIKSAASKAGIAAVSPHVFRHTAAVFLAEDGVPMEEIAQFLGHRSVEVTRRIYARYSPEYLRKAAGALEL